MTEAGIRARAALPTTFAIHLRATALAILSALVFGWAIGAPAESAGGAYLASVLLQALVGSLGP